MTNSDDDDDAVNSNTQGDVHIRARDLIRLGTLRACQSRQTVITLNAQTGIDFKRMK